MILVYLETSCGKLTKGALATVQAALQMKQHHGYSRAVGVLLGDTDVESAAAEAACSGVDEVIYVKDVALSSYLAESYESVFRTLLTSLSPRAVVAASTSRGKDLMPRLARLLDAGQASDCIGILPGGIFRRPMYAGNILAEVEIVSAVKVVTVRTSAFDPVPLTSSAAPVRSESASLPAAARTEFVSFDTVKSERPELTDAEVVVSGGRALKSAEGFEQYIIPLADALGAAVGASRAAVDSGYAPNDWQVGQTGKVVAPNLYIAIGISGAIQHLAGMKDSKTIVVINKDPEAPIFEVADYGLVADLFEVVPALTAEIKKRKG